MDNQTPPSALLLKVKGEAIPLFTTLLQSGVEVKTAGGQPLGALIGGFPGFSADYLSQRVQTIFLDGTAIDDLTVPLGRDHQVVALSAAMPGLAGAIFRRNSFHAALRTATGGKATPAVSTVITVTVKFFNSIAAEQGPALLARGVLVKRASLVTFFAGRPGLLENIVQAELGGQKVDPHELSAVLSGLAKINLRIIQIDA
jgi:hypothetical protein